VIKISDEGAGVIGGEVDGALMVLLSKVTAPFRARALPWMVAPVLSEIEERAKIFPANRVVVPRVAELPTCQNTLEAWAPLIRTTLLPAAVVSVLPI
jgi:hypothetical protein